MPKNKKTKLNFFAKNPKLPPDASDKEKKIRSNLEAPPSQEEPPSSVESAAEAKEKEKELTPQEIQKLKEEMEKTDIDDSLKMQAVSHAQDIKKLEEKEKIKKLLILAREKGVVYAINVAKKMEDPYLLDILHDILAKEGYYKSFLKKT